MPLATLLNLFYAGAALYVLGLLLRDVEVIHLVALGLLLLVRLLLVVLQRCPLSMGEP